MAKSQTGSLASEAVDGFLLAAVLALPWSTSAASIFIVLFTILLPFSTRVRPVVIGLGSAAGGLPVALTALAALGMAWSSATWSESLGAWDSYGKLLLIPPLLVHFRCSSNGPRLMGAFLASCSVLLLTCWIIWLWSHAFASVPLRELAAPVKNPATQLREFLLAAVGLSMLAAMAVDHQRWLVATALFAGSLAFLGSALYMAAFLHSLETLITLVALIVVLGWNARRSYRATHAVLLIFAIATAIWTAIPQVNQRIAMELQDLLATQDTVRSGPGTRGEFWRQAIGFISKAPVIGHGTGSTPDLFRRAKPVDSTQSVTINPHQQTLAVGIQLGGLGILLLWAMWCAHLRLFRCSHRLAWAGLLVVWQCIVGSLFDSLLFDFTEGWLYVVAVGVIGGTVHRKPVLKPRIQVN
jgi:hypothetical protein